MKSLLSGKWNLVTSIVVWVLVVVNYECFLGSVEGRISEEKVAINMIILACIILSSVIAALRSNSGRELVRCLIKERTSPVVGTLQVCYSLLMLIYCAGINLGVSLLLVPILPFLVALILFNRMRDVGKRVKTCETSVVE